ncbi:HigA family addiction module antitoxin [Caulobacter segnis]
MGSFLNYDFTSPLPHPGEILRTAYLAPRHMTAGALAKAMGMEADGRIDRVVAERDPVTADMALRLERVFGASAQFWMDLQIQHDLSKTATSSGAELKAIPRLAVARPK